MLRVIIATLVAGLFIASSAAAASPAVLVKRPSAAPKGTDKRANNKEDVKVFSCPSASGTFPHEAYCNIYYECHEYTAFIFACPYDWLFSAELLLCDYPENVDCNGLPISTTGPVASTTPEEEQSTTRKMTTEHGGLVSTDRTTTTSKRPFTCPSQDGDYANPNDCSTYFSCFGGDATLLHCPEGTNFNPATGWCEAGSDFCSDIGPTEDPGQSPDPTRTTKTTPRPFVCPAEDGLYPNPADCSNYYSCSGGNAFLMDCPPGTNFNPSMETCEVGEDFCSKNRFAIRRQDSSSSTALPPVTPSTWFVCPEPEGFFVSPYNCSVYFQCTNNLPWEEACSAGLWFDVANEECNWPSQVDCTANPTGFESKGNRRQEAEAFTEASEAPTEASEAPTSIAVTPDELTTSSVAFTTVLDEGTTMDETTGDGITTSEPLVTPVNWYECHSDGTYPNPYDCHSFIDCVFGNGWLQYCSPDTFVFDPETGRCEPPGSIACEESTGTPTPRTPPPVYTIDPGFVCEADGLFPYEQNCHFYYQCANQIVYLQACAVGLIFYPPKKRCAAISEVDVGQLTCQLHTKKDVSYARTLQRVMEDSARLAAMSASQNRRYRQKGWLTASKNSLKARRQQQPEVTRASARHDSAQVHRILRASIKKAFPHH